MSERPRLKDLDSGVPDWTQYHFATMFYMDEIEAGRAADKALLDGMQKECADAHNRAAKLEAENTRLTSAILKAYKALRKQGDHAISTLLYDALKATP